MNTSRYWWILADWLPQSATLADNQLASWLVEKINSQNVLKWLKEIWKIWLITSVPECQQAEKYIPTFTSNIHTVVICTSFLFDLHLRFAVFLCNVYKFSSYFSHGLLIWSLLVFINKNKTKNVTNFNSIISMIIKSTKKQKVKQSRRKCVMLMLSPQTVWLLLLAPFFK